MRRWKFQNHQFERVTPLRALSQRRSRELFRKALCLWPGNQLVHHLVVSMNFWSVPCAPILCIHLFISAQTDIHCVPTANKGYTIAAQLAGTSSAISAVWLLKKWQNLSNCHVGTKVWGVQTYSLITVNSSTRLSAHTGPTIVHMPDQSAQ